MITNYNKFNNINESIDYKEITPQYLFNDIGCVNDDMDLISSFFNVKEDYIEIKNKEYCLYSITDFETDISKNNRTKFDVLFLADFQIDKMKENVVRKITSGIYNKIPESIEYMGVLVKPHTVLDKKKIKESISNIVDRNIKEIISNITKYTFIDKYGENYFIWKKKQYKMIYKYNEYITEGLRDKMVGKSDDEILSKLNDMSDNDKIETIIKYQLDYDLLPRDKNGVCEFYGNLWVNNMGLTNLPDNLTVNGHLHCSYNNLTKLPDNLSVKGAILDCSNNNLIELPDKLYIGRHLHCDNNNLIELPDNLSVKGTLDCSKNNLMKLPDNLTVNRDLYCYNQKSGIILKLPESAKVNGMFINKLSYKMF